jgi:hypothetical protein
MLDSTYRHPFMFVVCLIVGTSVGYIACSRPVQIEEVQ